MEEFVQFDKMLTPSLIKIIFWAGLFLDLFFVISAIALPSLGISNLMPLTGPGGIILLLFIGLFFALFWRVLCERIIIDFKMHEELKRIATGSNAPSL
ncbi:MAG: DUF4282 domain-containing protein [Proteobacteria bacterium]|nr:DUF4282 domain-containing protein [Pseudomonadota bacterium]